jgi:manganese/zinc/iron transport system permease protein
VETDRGGIKGGNKTQHGEGGKSVNIQQFEIQLIAVVVSSSCALCGVFLVLRKMSLMSDAISHSILLGIVLAFFLTRNISSPLLVVAAALTGVLTVSLVELLNRTRLIKEDAAIGIIFPILFSVGVILISRYAGSIHLDTDAVLLGELAFAPFNRLMFLGYDIGPKGFWVMTAILIIDILFITIFYKELKLSTFDAGLALSLGFSSAALHYALMSMVSITAVGAFDAVGSILVVALMIAPPASAYLLSNKLSSVIILSIGYGICSAISGFWLATLFDVSIAGMMATMSGFLFLLTFLLSPNRGIIALLYRRAKQRWEFAAIMLAVHLFHHEGLPEAADENSVSHLPIHLKWDLSFSQKVLRRALKREFIDVKGEKLLLLDRGREEARKALVI